MELCIYEVLVTVAGTLGMLKTSILVLLLSVFAAVLLFFLRKKVVSICSSETGDGSYRFLSIEKYGLEQGLFLALFLCLVLTIGFAMAALWTNKDFLWSLTFLLGFCLLGLFFIYICIVFFLIWRTWWSGT